jgi:hypothetical protein
VASPARLPDRDAQVPEFWRSLGLPGLFDMHVHFLPPPVTARVREHFDRAGPLIGREWPIRYAEDDDTLVSRLRAMGVRRFTALPYAHRPGIAAYLNTWAADFAARHPDCVRSATFYPEEGAGKQVARLVEDGVEVFKVHVQVGDFDVRDPLLDEAWGCLAAAGTPVVVHAGSGPVPNSHTGPEPVAGLLRRHPSLCLVIAHCGAPEYDAFLDLAERFDRVHLDTTMVFTPFFEEFAPYPPDLLPRLGALQDKVLLGSDFPNIPYAYADQLAALARLDLDDEWLRAVCWGNGVRLLGVRAAAR